MHIRPSKHAHLSAQYKFNQSTGSANTAYEVAIGGDYAGLSVDAYYTKIKDAGTLSLEGHPGRRRDTQ